jgi:hypothetical protein
VNRGGSRLKSPSPVSCSFLLLVLHTALHEETSNHNGFLFRAEAAELLGQNAVRFEGVFCYESYLCDSCLADYLVEDVEVAFSYESGSFDIANLAPEVLDYCN